MHYHCEVVIPPTDNVEKAIDAVMRPFDENGSDNLCHHSFWDFWVIGGRWAGHKLMAKYDQANIDEFYAWLQAEKITVSGLRTGKEELQPASQAVKVDAKWNEMFPSPQPIPCPLFSHSNDQYGKGLSASLPDDVTLLSDVPVGYKCSRIIFAAPSYDSAAKNWTGPLEAKFMLCYSQWNGCNHMKVAWDGTFHAALEQYRESLKGYREEFAMVACPKGDWLVVTVDYHS